MHVFRFFKIYCKLFVIIVSGYWLIDRHDSCCAGVNVAAALHMSCVIQQKDARQWFAELAVDLEKVKIC